jgi:hypothetical protein
MDVQPIAVPQSLAAMISAAGDKSNVDFDYLVQTAMRESSLNPEAKAATSTAVGLFQFLKSTWLQVMKEEGPRLGYQQYADAITKTRDGDYVISDATTRAQILELREDPQIAADLAAAFTASNGAYLTEKFGRMPSPGELYIAHFLGAQGAEKMFTAGLADPEQNAAALFPRQASANPSIFYSHGNARTVKQVYLSLVAKHAPQPTQDAAFAAQQLAAAQQIATDALGVQPLGYASGELPLSTGLQPLQSPLSTQMAAPVSFAQTSLSFQGLFSTIATPEAGDDDAPANGAFFTHLYSQ